MKTKKFFCPTCLKFFEFQERINNPKCPFMPDFCPSTLFSVKYARPNVSGLSRMILFYPKIYQRLFDSLSGKISGNDFGENLFKLFVDEMNEWKIDINDDPLQFFRTFLIFLTGTEVLVKKEKNRTVYILEESGLVWDDRKKLKIIIEGASEKMRKILNFELSIFFNEFPYSDWVVEKYRQKSNLFKCVQCGMLFEMLPGPGSHVKRHASCPFMAHKCIFDGPTSIEEVSVSGGDFSSQFCYYPRLFKKTLDLFLENKQKKDVHESVSNVISEEIKRWRIEKDVDEIVSLVYSLLTANPIIRKDDELILNYPDRKLLAKILYRIFYKLNIDQKNIKLYEDEDNITIKLRRYSKCS
jgi:hypothetical protein